MKEKIGADAGIVWKILDEKGSQNVKELKKLAKLTEKELYAAIGWLAREEKLIFSEEGKEVFVELEK